MGNGIDTRLVCGFLNAGKTTYIQDCIFHDFFHRYGSVLILCFEEGEQSYDLDGLQSYRAAVAYYDRNEPIADFCARAIAAHRPDRIYVEMNAMLPKLRQLDDNVAAAALDLGATPLQALVKVIIPQIYPAIFSGALIAFSMSFDDFVISFFTAGVDVQNISMYVYSMKRFNPSVNALSTLIVAAVAIILVLANLIPALKERKNKKEEY